MKKSLRRAGALLLALMMALTLVIVPAGAAAGNSVTLPALELEEGATGTVDLSGVTAPDGYEDVTPDITDWKSSNNSIATVAESNGTITVTAVAEGTAEITATATWTKQSEVTPDPGPDQPAARDDSGDTDPVVETVTQNLVCQVTVKKPMPPAPATFNSVRVSAGELLGNASVRIGETLQLSAAPVMSDGSSPSGGFTVTWKSGDESVLTVNSSGLVTGVKASTTPVTVTATVKLGEESKEGTIRITVNNIPVTGMTVANSGRLSFDWGKIDTTAPVRTKECIATITPANATNRTVTWVSQDTTVATVTGTTTASNGRVVAQVTAQGPGQTKLIATAADGVSAECEVTVSGMLLNVSSYNLIVGKSFTLSIANSFGDAAVSGAASWETSDSSIATVSSGRVTGRAPGTATITARRNGYTATCVVTVSEDMARIIEVPNSVSAGMSLALSSVRTQINQACVEKIGQNLSYITNLSVPTTQGILYYNYNSEADTGAGVGITERYYYNNTTGQRVLSGLSFVPRTEFSGTADISYTGYAGNGESFTGIIRVSVAGLNDVTYSTTSGNALYFQASDFNSVCRSRTGRDLSYVSFELPAVTRGVLYYDFTGQTQYAEKVSANTPYYRTRSPFLESVSFLPAEGYIGTFRIPYRAVDTAGATFTGSLSITVTDSASSSLGTIRYNADQGQRVALQLSDFTTACQSVLGQTLDYVRFTLPSAQQGTLYYNYRASSSSNTRVMQDTRYYRSGTPNLSYITFVPASTDLDKVNIDFTGYTTSGGRFTGTVVISYSEKEAGVIQYTTQSSRAAEFEAADFNELCQQITGRSLNYVIFDDLPPSTRGTLYYNYYSSSGSGTVVSATTRCYRSSYPSLSRVAFVPRSNYTGTVSIGFIGYDTSGYQFTGTVQVTVEQGASSLTLRYRTRSDEPVTFSVDDFNSASLTATNANLSYVRFELPTASQGTLYHRYGQNNALKVSATTNYYRANSTYQVGNVSFVPAENFVGTVEIPYSAVSASNVRFNGVIVIEVYTPTAATLTYSGSSLPIALQGSNFQQVCNPVLGEELSYIRFTNLPDSSVGRLYYNYDNTTGSGTQVTEATSYYYSGTPNISQLSFVAKAGFQGVATLTYTAIGVKGEQITGSVAITISNSGMSSVFYDMSNYTWAIPSVEYLYQRKIVVGVGDNLYGPAQFIRRCDFVLMLCRTFGISGSSTYSYSDVSSGAYYASAISAAKDAGIAVPMSDGLFHPEENITREDAMVMLLRAMVANGVDVSSAYADLSIYTDSWKISPGARDAISAMVYFGVVIGNGNNQLNPTDTLSRAEIAVLLHRALTL